MTSAQKNRQTRLKNIMQKHDVSLEQAKQILSAQYRSWGRKGGKAEVPKGFAKLSVEKRIQISTEGGYAKARRHGGDQSTI